jgi:hypothetical protein
MIPMIITILLMIYVVDAIHDPSISQLPITLSHRRRRQQQYSLEQRQKHNRLLPRFHQQHQQQLQRNHFYDTTKNIVELRGGSSNSNHNNDNQNDYYMNENSSDTYNAHYRPSSSTMLPHNSHMNEDNNDMYDPNWDSSLSTAATRRTTTIDSSYPNEPVPETVQERHDRWKSQQLLQQYEQQQQAQSLSYSQYDPKGQTKLLLSISKSSRAIIFFIYMWRILHLYESVTGTSITTTSNTGEIISSTIRHTKNHLLSMFSTKSVLSIPLMLLFLANMMGTITSILSTQQQSHTTKKRLKAILNMNKFVELIVIVYTMMRLTILPSKYVTKEIYISRLFHSIIFIMQGQVYTRFSWDSESIAPSIHTYSTSTTTSNTPAANYGATTATTQPLAATTIIQQQPQHPSVDDYYYNENINDNNYNHR